MLTSLSIHNFAIIEDLDVSFYDQMSILTGETGAGKSILIDALSLLVGERSDFDKIREGATKAIIEGEFLITNQDLLAELASLYGEDLIEDNRLVISRVLDINGRSSIRLNGISLSLNKIKEIMNRVIDIHSQNQNLALLDEKNHLALLDAFIGENPLYEEYRLQYARYREEQQKLAKIAENRLNDHDIEILEQEIAELEQADIKCGEVADLESKKHDLMTAQKESSHLATFKELCDGDQGALTKLYLAKRELERSESSSTQELFERLNDLYYNLQDINNTINMELERGEDSVAMLQEIDERLFFIKRLMKKYGEDEEGLLSYLKAANERLYNCQHYEHLYQEQTKMVMNSYAQLQKAGLVLRSLRRQKADELSQSVIKEMHDLALENANFAIIFHENEVPHDNGMETVVFLISTNKGSRLLPLKQIASGGETSRIMLALKTVFSRYSALETIIFDEVDTGVSGRIAMHVARKMKEISSFVQVIAISHLPQVAAIADHHYYVQKYVENEMTKSSIRLLQDEEIIPEIAKLLSGDEITDISLKAARALRNEALK